MKYHFLAFYTHSNSLLANAVLYQNYGTLKYDGSQVTHSGLILEPDSSLITPDSLVMESTLKYGGVRLTTLKNIIKRNANLSVTEFDCPITIAQYDKMLDTAHEIEGLPYDLEGILGLAAGENWQDDDKFFCSEAKAYVLKKSRFAGVDWDKYDTGRITPRVGRGFAKQSVVKLGFV